MEFKSKSVLSQKFWLNPVFFLEISRVGCGSARGVIPQQVFPVDGRILKLLNKFFEDFLRDRISASELIEASHALESQMEEKLKANRLVLAAEEMELRVLPTVIFVNRILRHPSIFPDVQFFVGKQLSLKNLRNVERKVLEGKMKLEKGRREIIRLEGRILGYPNCCVESFVKEKTSNSPESRLILQCIESGTFDSLLNALANSRLTFFPQFFTTNFYPCSPDCRKAEEVGRRIEYWLEDEKLTAAFRLRTMVNLLYVLATAYRASKAEGEFAVEVRKYFSHLDSGSLEVVKAIENVIINITPFTNNLIESIVAGFSEKRNLAENQKN